MLFNRLVKRIQKDRAASLVHCIQADRLKDEIGARLVDRLYDISRRFDRVLDLGSGFGHLAKAMDKDLIGSLVQLESSSGALHRSVYDSVPITKVLGDEETLPFDRESFDAVLSNCSLHWTNDLPGVLIQATQALKPDGLFLGALFGGDTLFELRTCLQLAETERVGGLSPHVSPMTSTKDVGSLLSRAGLTLTTVDMDEITINYPSMFELMNDLKLMGEQNALMNRKAYTSRDVFYAASEAYHAIYGNQDGSIPATFQVIYMIGWKPHENQPKPLARGSAKTSLASVLSSSPLS